MKNDPTIGSLGRQKSASTTGFASSNNGSNNTGTLASASTGNLGAQSGQRTKAGVRAGSAKYYDIASTILGKSGDVETVFLNAAKTGNVTKLEQILSQRDHANLAIDCRDKKTGNTALIWAAKRGHSKAVELLLKHGADATLCNYEAQTAIELGFSPVKTVLLDWVEINQETTARLLLQAAWQGNLAVVCKLLSSGGSKLINCHNKEGLTPLMLVSRDIQLFERLAAQLNRHYCPVEVAEELIKAGADIHVTDNDGRSSLHYASQSRAGLSERLVNALIGGGMDPELRDKRLFTPIHLASQLGNTQNVLALIDGGSEVNVKGFGGFTPLHMTAYNDHQKTAVTLLSHGADVRIVDDRGYTALDLAKTRKMKITLKDAWTEATRTDEDVKTHTDINSNINSVSNENKSQGKDDDPKRKKSAPAKKRPEVIFDNSKTINNPHNITAASKNKALNNVERCKQREKKILEDVEALKAAHPVLQRETTRMLGTTRNKILPQIGRSSSPERSHQKCLTPNLDEDGFGFFNRGDESRWSLEETRLQLLSRGRSVSDIKLGIGRQSRLASLPSQDSDVLILEDARSSIRSSPVFDRKSHQRTGSDPAAANMGDIAASCEQFFPNTKVKRSNGRDKSCSPAFITQQSFTLMNKEQGKMSPFPEDICGHAVTSPMEVLRCKSFFKEDFILEDSRPKEMTSGSDPASSASSLSSSSPRDQSSVVPHSPSKTHKRDHSLSTLIEQSERRSALQRKMSNVLEKDNTEIINYEVGVKPVIRDPQRRIRRNSDNSASLEIYSSSDFSKTEKVHKERGIIRTHSQRNVPNLLTGSTLSPRLISSVKKSQSLESLSPKISSQIVHSPRNDYVPDITKTKDAGSDILLRDGKLSSIKTSTLGNDYSAPKPVSSTKSILQTSEDKISDSIHKIAPFSGKARVINNDELDKWDSLNQKRDVHLQEEAANLSCIFTPVKSAQEPHNSLSNVDKGNNKHAQVSKSCTDGVKIELGSSPMIRSHTSENENVSAKKSQTTKSNLYDMKSIKEKSKQLVSSKNLKSQDANIRKSAQSSSVMKTLSNPKLQSFMVTSSQDIGDKQAAQLDSSRVNTVSQLANISSKSYQQMGEESEESEESEGESNTVESEISVPVNNMFVVSDESVRQGSASKVRMKERLASEKRQKNEAWQSKTKEVEENADVATKDKPITKVVAKIEQSLRKNETQIALQRKSQTSLQHVAKSKEEISLSAAKQTNLSKSLLEKGKNMKDTNQSNKPKISSVSVTQSHTNLYEREGKSGGSPSTPHKLKSSSSLSSSSPASKTFNDSKSGASKQKTVAATPVSVSSKQSTSSLSKSEKSLTESKQAKALDPNVILTPRSTEPLVKIKLQSNSSLNLYASYSGTQKTNTGITSTPLIVNPFEEFAQNDSHPLQQTTKDAVVKLKKTPKTSISSKVSKKNSTSTKRPLSGSSRQSSATGKKRSGRGKDTKPENQKDVRPKSSKKSGRMSKKKDSKEPSDLDLIEEVEKPDAAIISGIDWQLSTSCLDSSNLHPAKEISSTLSPDSSHLLNKKIMNGSDMQNLITSDFREPSHVLLDSIESESMKMNVKSNIEKQALEVIKEKITLNSPRFLEMKRRQESQTNIELPILTNDGFPPMNLDMTQDNSHEVQWQLKDESSEGLSHNDSLGQIENNEAIQREIFLNKLTPIPEASFVSRTISAISKFDKSVKNERLTQLLEDTPREETFSGVQYESKSGKKENEDHYSPPISKNDSYNYEYTYTSMGKTIKRTQSLKNKALEKPVKERRFSETKCVDANMNDEDETIEEAIEEILSSTMSSTTSTLKGGNQKSNLSANNNQTEGDKNVLKKLNAVKDSPFYANFSETRQSVYSPLPQSPQDNTEQRNDKCGKKNASIECNSSKQIISSVDKNSKAVSRSVSSKPPLSNRSSLILQNTPRSTPTMKRSTSMKDARSKGVTEAVIDVKALEMSEEESKHLARVMNSLRNMELHAGSQNHSTQQEGCGGSPQVLKMSKGDFTKTQGASLPASALVRPLSTGAAVKCKGRFHELKANPSDSGINQPLASQDVKGPLPIGTKESIQQALEMSEEESKHLVQVMNSLRNMELHAGSQNHSTQQEGSKGDFTKTPGATLPASAVVRPSSTGAAVKIKGRFHELKANPSGSGINQALVSQDVKGPLPIGKKESIQTSGEQQSLKESLHGDLDHLADVAEIQNLYIRLTERRDSLCGSEFSVDSVKSVDDTIQWKKGNVLGKGAFGTVWCGLTSEGELIAVKQIELTTMDQAKAHHEYEKIQEEVELLKTLNHINIVGYLGTSLEDNVVSIFMQFIPGGSLASILARFGALEESVFQRYTKQILEGVEYLHDNDVIHRDLKGANVMLMPTGVIKLIDFGCAKRLCINLNLSHTEILKSMKGTPFWMAPEVVNETGHGKKSDIWSIGCTVFEMATRKPPWAEMNPMAAIFAIGRAGKPAPNLPEKFSQDAIEFVSACMTRDQEQRPSATELLNHIFITRRNTRKISKIKEENISVC